MPKKGIVKCEECNAEFEGTLPDNEPVGWNYMSIYGDLDEDLVNKLQEHHAETARVTGSFGGLYGHRDFEVFLEKGKKGKLEANSYAVIYKELGKERF